MQKSYNKIQNIVQNIWYKKKLNILLKFLLPLSILYYLIISIRKFFYKHSILPRVRLKVPIVIIGNITVGGTGKTPVVICLVNLLKANGFNPGVISRGYKSSAKQNSIVNVDSSPLLVGDEPVLIAKRTNCPVVVGKNRVKAAKYLIEQFSVDLVISDDGLQHYALQRDLEVIVIDGRRRFGNGYCLPLGPLRELPIRLRQADLLLVNGGEPLAGEHKIEFSSGKIYNLKQQEKNYDLLTLKNNKIHAIAGVGCPEKFFDYLKVKGLDIIPHVFSDHYSFKKEDLEFQDNYPILMTEKDAIKCQSFAKSNYWFLPIEIKLSLEQEQLFLLLINQAKNGN